MSFVLQRSAARRVRRCAAWASLPPLPGRVWALLGGECLSAVGSGLTLPFVLVYLHRVRGIELEVAGLVLTVLAAVGLVGNPLGGWLADRFGARRALVGGLLWLSLGALSLALVREPWHAFAAAALFGLGAAVVWPAQDTLLACLSGSEHRAGAFALRYATMNLGLGVGSVAGALVVDLTSPTSFEALFALEAMALVLYAGICVRLPNMVTQEPRRRDRSGWRPVVADRRLWCLLPLVTLLFAAGYGQYHAAFPAYATGPGQLGASALGAAFAANTFTIVVAQLVVFRVVRGWRRSRGLAIVGAVWAAAWLVALLAGTRHGGLDGAAMFALALALFGVGETVLAPCLGPLVNDLASEELRGRYNGASALASTAGYILGPAVAGAALAAGYGVTLLIALALACALATLAALTLERGLPAAANRSVAATRAPVAEAVPA